jgi:SAM-dependent methyltransferase
MTDPANGAENNRRAKRSGGWAIRTATELRREMHDLPDALMRAGFNAEPFDGQATGHAVEKLEHCLETIAASNVAGGRLLDLGCSWGTLGVYVAGRLDLGDVVGVDRVPDRLAWAAQSGVDTILADLTTDLPLPLEDGTVAVVTSFGAVEHLLWYDDFLREVHRLLAPNGWLLLSMPNLGSYVNRIALFAGYQPRDVEVARQSTPGILPIYRSKVQRAPLGHPHVATVRCMRQLLNLIGMEVVEVHGFGPHANGFSRLPDHVFNRFPSLSRRVLILARKTT